MYLHFHKTSFEDELVLCNHPLPTLTVYSSLSGPSLLNSTSLSRVPIPWPSYTSFTVTRNFSSILSLTCTALHAPPCPTNLRQSSLSAPGNVNISEGVAQASPLLQNFLAFPSSVSVNFASVAYNALVRGCDVCVCAELRCAHKEEMLSVGWK